MSIIKDLSISAVVAGFVTVLVGFTSSGVIVFQAAQALGANAAQTSSWLWALGVGMALTSIVLSLYYRIPIVTAWSTAGAVMLIDSAQRLSLAEAIGCFMVSGALIAMTGFSGVFSRVMNKIPLALASAMLAGILLRFSLNAFAAIQTNTFLVLAMLAAYLCCRQWQARYGVLAALVVGICVAQSQQTLHWQTVSLTLTQPVAVMPVFSWSAILGVAIPLFIVTMASQNMAGVAAMRSFGFHPPLASIIGWTGIATMMFAPFGAFAISLAAITAAICLSGEAHEQKHKRYVAAICAGLFYLLMAIFADTITYVFSTLPKDLVVALAGIALLSTIGNSLAAALVQETQREAALMTFLVTASGLSLWGISAAFWGICAGVLVLAIQKLTVGR
ncbi:benzoate/H(+) symporter BenE family transporter [Agitococcus lubricus]|uniref:Benzoate membrane transport protein n=1 Tax=Agitococcus lubricus TaxID=1077255 RepID=A0A2T5J0N6_9GAMM|nr:benzoate/H(+) symporter BenE family transporter [Agitococcus lubricus]PTQ89831.1 benzoate membrane transport protein [Agitococcus lubricus]